MCRETLGKTLVWVIGTDATMSLRSDRMVVPAAAASIRHHRKPACHYESEKRWRNSCLQFPIVFAASQAQSIASNRKDQADQTCNAACQISASKRCQMPSSLAFPLPHGSSPHGPSYLFKMPLCSIIWNFCL